MDITQLFVGMVLLVQVVMLVWLVTIAEGWRAAVMALHLRWEREQRQAATAGVPLPQRQMVQTAFEGLVSSRPVRLLWLHTALTIAAIVFALMLAWQQDDLQWIGLWLVAPFGLVAAAGLLFVWLQMRDAANRLSTISSTLYGPAPPRVKIRTLQASESES